jgi:hypothetical protein
MFLICRYGKALKEAAEAFLRENEIQDLLTELGDIEGIKKALKEAMESHNDIQ